MQYLSGRVHDLMCQMKHFEEQIISKPITNYAFPIIGHALYIVHGQFETNP